MAVDGHEMIVASQWSRNEYKKMKKRDGLRVNSLLWGVLNKYHIAVIAHIYWLVMILFS